MYREDSWQEGFYIDNHVKFECSDCRKQFIVGEKLLEGRLPHCPYCGEVCGELVGWTKDEDLERLSGDIGCLAIYFDL
jgi:hypothetical protein